jgi:hypothetical protein
VNASYGRSARALAVRRAVAGARKPNARSGKRLDRDDRRREKQLTLDPIKVTYQTGLPRKVNIFS